VTFDSTAKPSDPLVLKAISAGWHVAFSSVTLREARRTDFEVQLNAHESIPEVAVWNESEWDKARWADKPSSERLESILAIVSGGGFPKNRSDLTDGQLHQLRDAMILEAHVAAERELFVTADLKAFISGGRRASLEALLDTRILSPVEFNAELGTCCAQRITSRLKQLRQLRWTRAAQAPLN